MALHGHCHVLQDFAAGAPKHELAEPGVAVAAHHDQVGAEIGGAVKEIVTDLDAGSHGLGGLALDPVSCQRSRDLAVGCPSCLVWIDRQDADGLGRLKNGKRVEYRAYSLPSTIPGHQNAFPARREASRVWDNDRRPPALKGEALRKIEQQMEIPRLVRLAGDDEISRAGLVEDGFGGPGMIARRLDHAPLGDDRPAGGRFLEGGGNPFALVPKGLAPALDQPPAVMRHRSDEARRHHVETDEVSLVLVGDVGGHVNELTDASLVVEVYEDGPVGHGRSSMDLREPRPGSCRTLDVDCS